MQQVNIIPAIVVIDVVVKFVIYSIVVVADSVVTSSSN